MKMDAGNPASACKYVVVEGKREQSRPRKTWSQLIRNDLRRLKLNPKLAQNRRLWRRAIMRPRPAYASMETDAKQ